MQLIGVVPTDTSVLARTGEIYDNDGDKSQAFQYYYDVSCLPSFNFLVDHILFCFEIFSSFYLVPGIAFNCQEALWPQHGRHIYVRPRPGLERTTAGLDGRRSNH